MANKNSYTGIYGSSKSFLISKIFKETKKVFLVAKDNKELLRIKNDLEFFNLDQHTFILPQWDILPFEALSPQVEISAERINTLNVLKKLDQYIVITTPQSILQKFISYEEIKNREVHLKEGSDIEREGLLNFLITCGYQRVEIVEASGQFSIRGGVVDFFPFSEKPIRLRFIANSIEEISFFSPSSQRTTGKLKEIKIIPIKESITPNFFSDSKDKDNFIKKIKDRSKELTIPNKKTDYIITSLKEDETPTGCELLTSIGLDNFSSFEKYLDSSTQVIIDDYPNFLSAIDSYSNLIDEKYNLNIDSLNLIPRKDSLFIDNNTLEKIIKNKNFIQFSNLKIFKDSNSELSPAININSSLITEIKHNISQQIPGSLSSFKENINNWREKGFKIAFIINSKNRINKLIEILLGFDLEARKINGEASEWLDSSFSHPLAIFLGEISEGFILRNEKTIFISENDIFPNKTYRKHSNITEKNISKLINEISLLKIGDYVVHEDYGIGIYHGLKNIQVEKIKSDFIELEYLDSKLFLPIQNINKIQKYSSGKDVQPKLDKLSSQRWIQIKKKVKASLFNLAGDLLKLYASRSSQKGWTFDLIGSDDEIFAEDFPYNETEDQLNAINDVLKDMSSPKPMDRLVCGDVGFGKTEVAMRAAFKACQHAKQVAVLVPTTILVEQHLQSFKERFANFSFNIKALSRFYPASENKKTIEEINEGKTDIIIGTHKLLQSSVNFKDLGLLIIDEEHRFGVKQKERLKNYKEHIDVLTLTATPIPRTLHMALNNIRDISIISTPPTNRKNVKTYIANRDETLIRDIVLKELQRQGQVFFVHNRVQSIASISAGLQELIPEAKIRFAHGQMSEKELENIMFEFINNQFDVLVSTSIIESGLDIENANTMIIDKSDHFGLAQLYQLRGRVGRSERQGYAYLLIPEIKKLTKDAKKRLEVLQNIDNLGQGFSLALRDLEIRGAGNLLGREQSGSVFSVGYELYTKLLKEAVNNIKGDKPRPEDTVDPEVKVKVLAFIPETYIPDISQRLIIYQRLASILSENEFTEINDELIDRFGYLPEEVFNLINLMRIRALLKKYGVEKCEIKDNIIRLLFTESSPINSSKVLETINNNSKYDLKNSWLISISYKEKNEIDLLQSYQFIEKLIIKIKK
ncbi:UNVERIFIED_CONTAM: hypothetical protein GTU68_063519 [Idotea baltica]|nr:hypothetical protein [Idotea baltica]